MIEKAAPSLLLPGAAAEARRGPDLRTTVEMVRAFSDADFSDSEFQQAVGAITPNSIVIADEYLTAIAESLSRYPDKLRSPFGPIRRIDLGPYAKSVKGHLFEGLTLSLLLNKPAFRDAIGDWVLTTSGPEARANLMTEVRPLLTAGTLIREIIPNESSPAAAADIVFAQEVPGGGFEKLVCPESKLPVELQVKAVRSSHEGLYGSIVWAVIGWPRIGFGRRSSRDERFASGERVGKLNGRYKHVLSWLSCYKTHRPVWEICHEEVNQLQRDGWFASAEVADEVRDRIRGPEHFGIDQDWADYVADEFERLITEPSDGYDTLRAAVGMEIANRVTLYQRHFERYERTRFQTGRRIIDPTTNRWPLPLSDEAREKRSENSLIQIVSA